MHTTDTDDHETTSQFIERVLDTQAAKVDKAGQTANGSRTAASHRDPDMSPSRNEALGKRSRSRSTSRSRSRSNSYSRSRSRSSSQGRVPANRHTLPSQAAAGDQAIQGSAPDRRKRTSTYPRSRSRSKDRRQSRSQQRSRKYRSYSNGSSKSRSSSRSSNKRGSRERSSSHHTYRSRSRSRSGTRSRSRSRNARRSKGRSNGRSAGGNGARITHDSKGSSKGRSDGGRITQDSRGRSRSRSKGCTKYSSRGYRAQSTGRSRSRSKDRGYGSYPSRRRSPEPKLRDAGVPVRTELVLLKNNRRTGMGLYLWARTKTAAGLLTEAMERARKQHLLGPGYVLSASLELIEAEDMPLSTDESMQAAYDFAADPRSRHYLVSLQRPHAVIVLRPETQPLRPDVSLVAKVRLPAAALSAGAGFVASSGLARQSAAAAQSGSGSSSRQSLAGGTESAMGGGTDSAAAGAAFGDDEGAAAAAASSAAAEPSGSRGKGRIFNTNFWQDSEKHAAAEARFALLLSTAHNCAFAEEGSAVEYTESIDVVRTATCGLCKEKLSLKSDPYSLAPIMRHYCRQHEQHMPDKEVSAEDVKRHANRPEGGGGRQKAASSSAADPSAAAAAALRGRGKAAVPQKADANQPKVTSFFTKTTVCAMLAGQQQLQQQQRQQGAMPPQQRQQQHDQMPPPLLQQQQQQQQQPGKEQHSPLSCLGEYDDATGMVTVSVDLSGMPPEILAVCLLLKSGALSAQHPLWQAMSCMARTSLGLFNPAVELSSNYSNLLEFMMSMQHVGGSAAVHLLNGVPAALPAVTASSQALHPLPFPAVTGCCRRPPSPSPLLPHMCW